MLSVVRRQCQRRPLVAFGRALATSPSVSNSGLSVLDSALQSIGLETPAPRTEIQGISPSLTAPPPPSPISVSNTASTLIIPPSEDPLLHYIASVLTKSGKRHLATRSTVQCLQHIHAFTRQPPLPIVRAAVLAASPAVRCISFKQGSKKVYKPVAMGEKQRTQIAMYNIIEAAKRRPGKTLAERLAREFIGILQPGTKAKPVEQKETLHKLAMVNRGNLRVRM